MRFDLSFQFRQEEIALLKLQGSKRDISSKKIVFKFAAGTGVSFQNSM